MPDGLPVEVYMAILDEVKKNFGTGVYIALTGGEPLMYKDFFKLTGYIQSLGMKWGMTSNATLITKSVAERLRDTGMRGISVSIDGLPDTHDRYRSFPNGFKKAMVIFSYSIQLPTKALLHTHTHTHTHRGIKSRMIHKENLV